MEMKAKQSFAKKYALFTVEKRSKWTSFQYDLKVVFQHDLLGAVVISFLFIRKSIVDTLFQIEVKYVQNTTRVFLQFISYVIHKYIYILYIMEL